MSEECLVGETSSIFWEEVYKLASPFPPALHDIAHKDAVHNGAGCSQLCASLLLIHLGPLYCRLDAAPGRSSLSPDLAAPHWSQASIHWAWVRGILHAF